MDLASKPRPNFIAMFMCSTQVGGHQPEAPSRGQARKLGGKQQDDVI